MASFLLWIKLAFSLIPLVIEAIKALETAIPGSGKGTNKLALVKAVFEQVQGYAEGFDVNKVWALIEGTVNSFVSIFNTVGIFKSGSGNS